MARMVKKLSGLEIDEVSLVDRPANQHGLVAIAKRQEDGMSIFDAQGNEVDEAELEHGDVVYDDNGTELVYVEGETGEDAGDEGDYEDEDGEVGKADYARLGRRAHSLATITGMRARSAPGQVREAGARGARRGREAGERVGRRARGAGTAAGMQYRAIPAGGRAGIRYGGAAAAGAGADYEGRKHFGKSLGESVLEDLSKALTEDARDEVIAKALDQFGEIAKRNEALEELVMDLYEDRQAQDFTEVAKGYELPVDPDALGGLMYRASQALPQEDVAALDRIFASYGEVAKSYMDEVGYGGTAESDILAQVYATAGQAVGKSAGAITQEQAVTALFEANPAAYDEYEAEQRRR